MANIKVSEMTEATSFDDGDYTMIVQANQNKKISKENILGDIENNISTLNTNIGDLSNLETEDKSSLVNAINEFVPIILYSNETGTNGNINLNDDASNYSYLEIYYNRNNLGFASTKIDTNFMNNVSLFTSYYDQAVLRFYVSNISINGNLITRNYSRTLNVNSDLSLLSVSDTYFYINKVIGYK